MSWYFSIAAAQGALALQACSTFPSNPLSTSASMVVEVDVYKGPLSLRSRCNWGNCSP